MVDNQANTQTLAHGKVDEFFQELGFRYLLFSLFILIYVEFWALVIDRVRFVALLSFTIILFFFSFVFRTGPTAHRARLFCLQFLTMARLAVRSVSRLTKDWPGTCLKNRFWKRLTALRKVPLRPSQFAPSKRLSSSPSSSPLAWNGSRLRVSRVRTTHASPHVGILFTRKRSLRYGKHDVHFTVLCRSIS